MNSDSKDKLATHLEPDSEPLLSADEHPSEGKSPIRLYTRRWYILFVYCINCVVYSASYILYISIPETTQDYYEEAGITTSDLNRTLTLCMYLLLAAVSYSFC